MTMKQVEEEYKKLMDEIEASKERVESEAWWKSRCEELAKLNKEHQKLNGELRKENDALITVIDLAKHFIKKYETIRGYYEYEECGYDEYNYEDDLKQELLEILERVDEE